MIVTDKDFNRSACDCGRAHSTSIKKIVIGRGCLQTLPQQLDELGLSGVTAVYDSNTICAKGLIKPFANAEVVLPAENLHATEVAVEMLEKALCDAPNTGVLAAVGAGTVHDLVRYVAAQRGIPFISCPTAATVDGFASGVAAMTWHGFKKTMQAAAPVLVLADLNVIAAAPLSLALSGAGDLLGKEICLADWEIGHLLTGEYHCGYIEGMTREAVKGLYSTAHGLITGDEKAYEALMYGLLLSGVAMQLIGNSRCASGAEHHISHLLELGVYGEYPALHGEKVGVATPICAGAYHKLCKKKPVLLPFSPLTASEIEPVFGALTKDILEENENNCLAAVTPKAFNENWEGICAAVARIPTQEWLTEFLQGLGAKALPEDIGVPQELVPKLLHNSPLVRNRLTLMRTFR